LEKCSHFSAYFEGYSGGGGQAGTATFCPMQMRAGRLQVVRGVWKGVKSGILDPAWIGRDLLGREVGSARIGLRFPVFSFFPGRFSRNVATFWFIFGKHRREYTGRNSHVLLEDRGGVWVLGY
jgi:hypothetical protein